MNEEEWDRMTARLREALLRSLGNPHAEWRRLIGLQVAVEIHLEDLDRFRRLRSRQIEQRVAALESAMGGKVVYLEKGVNRGA